MLKIKTFNVDLFIVALFFICIALLFALIGVVSYSFYFYNSVNRNQSVIYEYIDKASLKSVKSKVAESIINYQASNLDIDSAKVKNPFRIIVSEEE